MKEPTVGFYLSVPATLVRDVHRCPVKCKSATTEEKLVYLLQRGFDAEFKAALAPEKINWLPKNKSDLTKQIEGLRTDIKKMQVQIDYLTYFIKELVQSNQSKQAPQGLEC